MGELRAGVHIDDWMFCSGDLFLNITWHDKRKREMVEYFNTPAFILSANLTTLNFDTLPRKRFMNHHPDMELQILSLRRAKNR